MKQHPDPIEPFIVGSIQLAVNGNPFPFPVEMIPKLFVAYVAALRAEYYAGVDAARCDTKEAGRACFEQIFHEEIRHAMRDRSEIRDWMENNMDVENEKADEIGVAYLRAPAAGKDEGQQ